MAFTPQEIADIRATILAEGLMCQLSRNGDLIDVPALLTTYTRSELGFQNTDGSMILPDDRKALLPGGLERNPDSELDRFIIPPCDVYPDGDDVRIVKATPTAPSGQAALWELQLRK